jgi:hydroxymethylglutaryl-CoA lyase
VIDMVGRFRNAGIKRQYLAGSIGMEDPAHVNRLFRKLYAKYPDVELGFHIHNLSGMATANIVAAMDAACTGSRARSAASAAAWRSRPPWARSATSRSRTW